MLFFQKDISFLDFSKHLNKRNPLQQRTIFNSPFTAVKFNNPYFEDEEDTNLAVNDDQKRSTR